LDLDTTAERHGVSNYRAITGISAPNRSKQYPIQKPDNLIAPWKMQKRNRIMNKQAQQNADQKSYNDSSQIKNNLHTKESGNDSKSNSTNKHKVKIPKITNREGLRSQPVKTIASNDQMISRNTTSKNPNTEGKGLMPYQTPSFLSPK
jgi:CHAT domain-containing protein